MPNRRKTRVLAIAALAVGAFFVLTKTGWLRPVTERVTRWIFSSAAPLYRVGATMGSLADAASADRVTSPSELEALRSENARLRTLIAENDALKDALGYKESGGGNTIVARVVSRTTGDLFHGLVIDRGSEDGIAPDQPAVAGDGVIVGKVMSVSPHTAAVMLLTDSRSRLAVAMQGASDTIGVLEGDRGISLSVGLIPQHESISPGDTVVTSGLEPGIRRGLVVGTVDKVSREAQDPFQSAAIVPMTAAERPMFVEVLLTPGLE